MIFTLCTDHYNFYVTQLWLLCFLWFKQLNRLLGHIRERGRERPVISGGLNLLPWGCNAQIRGKGIEMSLVKPEGVDCHTCNYQHCTDSETSTQQEGGAWWWWRCGRQEWVAVGGARLAHGVQGQRSPQWCLGGVDCHVCSYRHCTESRLQSGRLPHPGDSAHCTENTLGAWCHYPPPLRRTCIINIQLCKY